MNDLFIAAAGGGNPIAEIADQFGVTWPLLISQTILFVIVALLLKKFAYQPILDMLEKRKQTIAESLSNADKIKQELANTEAARQEVLDKANAQANNLIQEARDAAAKVLEHETQKAISTAEQIIAKAHEATEADRAKMMSELKAEIGRLVVETTGKVTGKILTVEDQQRLVEETNREIAA